MKILLQILFFFSNSLFSAVYFQHLSSSWYPTQAKPLRQKLEFLEQQAQEKFPYYLNPDQVTAVVVPHAGYDYSGVVAASVYQSITKNNFKRVIILGPSHHIFFEGIAIPEVSYEYFHNSLGSVSLDNTVLKKLHNDLQSLCIRTQKVFDLEHSIEIQIPFIQKYCPHCSIIPIIIGNLDQQKIIKVSQALQQYLDSQTLLVVTTDLTHFGKDFGYEPFNNNIGSQIAKLDESIVSSLTSISLEGFQKIIEQTKATVCGFYPIQILLEILQHQPVKNNGYVIAYDRSTHEKNPKNSVSYVGIVFSKQQKNSMPLNNRLTGYEKNLLKKLSLKTLQNLFNVSNDNYKMDDILTQTLQQSWGAFVTLYTKDHQLRGCIGRIVSDKPLYQTVCDMTRAAALEDIRFKPVSAEEIPNLTLSISVLNQPQAISSFDKIQLGIDGIILKYNNKSALFLPHVAIEQGWDVPTTLTELSRKAGLKADDWRKKDARFEVFQTIDI